jgi:Flp pilus assembly protein TadD
MSGNSGFVVRLGAVLLGCLGAAMVQPVPAAAQSYVGRTAESPSDALARHVRILASSPRDFNALIGAGKAALAIGDSQAAAGFFGRAEEVWPQNSQPQVGMGAALAHEGDANAALQYFARAVQLGATPVMVGLERGLAFDLLGQHVQAQSDYRAAMAGPDADEARRRLALSLAIAGKKDEALKTLGPLMAKGDAGGARCRAFVLALTGDAGGARAAIDRAMPGASYNMDYFFRRLPSLRSDQKAAAVHLGQFPDSGQLAGVAPPASAAMAGAAVSGSSSDRLASIEDFLRPTPSAAQPAPQASPPVQTASVRRPPVRTAATRSAADGKVYSDSKVWLQLASGNNADALPGQFRRMKSRNDELFDGLSGYVAEEAGKARLLIGPFRSRQDAQLFADDLASVSIDAFSWTSRPGQILRKLPAE